MAVSFVGAGALASGDAPATLTPALPGGTQAGDLIFAFAFDRGGTANVVRTPPSGYTVLYSGTTSSISAQFYYKVHDGSEPNPVFSWSGSAWATPAADAGAQVAVFRGVDTTTPINVLGTTSSAGPGSADIGPIATFTPTASGAAIVAFGAKRASIGGAGFAVLSGDGLTWNEIGDHSVALGAGVAGVWDYALGWTSGAITAKTFNTASTSTQSWVGRLFSLTPAATAVTTVTAVPASATASRAVPLPKLKATAPRGSATASRPVPLPKLTVVSPISLVGTFALLESADHILLESGDSLTQEIPGGSLTASATASRPAPVPKVKMGPSAASATASRAVPALQTTASRILHSPVASAAASFPAPIATSSGATAVTPPASAAASLPGPTPKVTLTAPKGSATASALTPLPRLTIHPAPAFATAFGLVPNSRTVVIGVPCAGASAQALVPVPKIAVLPDAMSATAMGVPPNMPTPSGQFLARLPTHLIFARNTTTLVLEGAEIELVIDG